jgi:membrane protein YqaA with SNARE-associated domain
MIDGVTADKTNSCSLSKNSSENEIEVSYKINHVYLMGFALTYCLCSTIASGVILGETSQLNFIFAYKLGWYEDGTAITYMSFMSNSRVLGLGLGSIFGSKIIANNGNENLRIVFYRYIIIGMFAVGLKFIPNLFTSLAGGAIHGYSQGVLNICF